ncbi:MAG: DUF218 domain-containing protein [Bacilli bacterium]|nr:DUF218 domain-containing protein [Bacilli bacterium]
MKWIKWILFSFLGCFFFGILVIVGINFHVISSTKDQILTLEEVQNIKEVEVILVLGCQVRPDQTPSAMLEDRLKTSILLYEHHVAPSIIMSGDHREDDYNEVKVMKAYAVSHEVPSMQIFLDHDGISTYDSIVRAKEVFGVKKMVIVTQQYHLYRALYIAKEMEIEAYGVASDTVTYSNQFYREMREVLARNKDFVLSHLKVGPVTSSSKVSLDMGGDFTN